MSFIYCNKQTLTRMRTARNTDFTYKKSNTNSLNLISITSAHERRVDYRIQMSSLGFNKLLILFLRLLTVKKKKKIKIFKCIMNPRALNPLYVSPNTFVSGTISRRLDGIYAVDVEGGKGLNDNSSRKKKRKSFFKITSLYII